MSNSKKAQATSAITTTTQAQKRAATLVKKTKVVPTELQVSTDRTEVKPTLINRVGQAIASYNREELAERGSDALAGFVKRVSKVAINDTLFAGEHALVDTATVATDVAEVVSRTAVNGTKVAAGIAAWEAQKALKSANAKAESDQKQLKAAVEETDASIKAVVFEAAERVQGLVDESVTTPIQKRFAQQDAKVLEIVTKARQGVAAYTATEAKVVIDKSQLELTAE